MQCVHILFVVTWCALAINTGFATPNYVETRECDVRKVKAGTLEQ